MTACFFSRKGSPGFYRKQIVTNANLFGVGDTNFTSSSNNSSLGVEQDKVAEVFLEKEISRRTISYFLQESLHPSLDLRPPPVQGSPIRSSEQLPPSLYKRIKFKNYARRGLHKNALNRHFVTDSLKCPEHSCEEHHFGLIVPTS